jgi:hypothetical protein
LRCCAMAWWHAWWHGCLVTDRQQADSSHRHRPASSQQPRQTPATAPAGLLLKNLRGTPKRGGGCCTRPACAGWLAQYATIVRSVTATGGMASGSSVAWRKHDRGDAADGVKPTAGEEKAAQAGGGGSSSSSKRPRASTAEGESAASLLSRTCVVVIIVWRATCCPVVLSCLAVMLAGLLGLMAAGTLLIPQGAAAYHTCGRRRRPDRGLRRPAARQGGTWRCSTRPAHVECMILIVIVIVIVVTIMVAHDN